MRAIVITKKGPPEVLQVQERESLAGRRPRTGPDRRGRRRSQFCRHDGPCRPVRGCPAAARGGRVRGGGHGAGARPRGGRGRRPPGLAGDGGHALRRATPRRSSSASATSSRCPTPCRSNRARDSRRLLDRLGRPARVRQPCVPASTSSSRPPRAASASPPRRSPCRPARRCGARPRPPSTTRSAPRAWPTPSTTPRRAGRRTSRPWT